MVHAKNSSQKSSDAQHCSGVTSGCWALPAPCDAPASVSHDLEEAVHMHRRTSQP